MSTLRVPRALSSLIAAAEIGLLVALAPGQVNAQVAQPGSKAAAARPVPAAGAKAKAKAVAVEVEEMVVTARHRAELITETPVVITAVTGEQIEEKGIGGAGEEVHIDSLRRGQLLWLCLAARCAGWEGWCV